MGGLIGMETWMCIPLLDSSQQNTKNPPPPPDHDAIQASQFNQQQVPPEVNNPDRKYMARVTKYGHIFIMGDQGYHWQKGTSTSTETVTATIQELDSQGSPIGTPTDAGTFQTTVNSELGEFTGDFQKDEEFETKRWKALQKLLNEGKPKAEDGDQRRIEARTRYGHKLEMRDVGWAQESPKASKTREGEFGPPATVSKGQRRPTMD